MKQRSKFYEDVQDNKNEDQEEASLEASSAILQSGADYSDKLISDRDDEDPCITFRSIILLTLSTILCSASAAIASFRPVHWSLSGILIYLIIFFIGKAWYKLLPTRETVYKRLGQDRVENSRVLSLFAAMVHFINPHDFGIKEHGIISTTSQREISDFSNICVQQLLFFPQSPLTTVDLVCGNLSVAFMGFAFAPMFRSMLVYPSEMVWYSALPDLTFYQTLHWEPHAASRYKTFWILVGVGLVYEFVPVYMMPWLSAVSIPCLIAMHAKGTAGINYNNIFGGSVTNQGMGLLSFCFDWQYIGSHCLTLPIGYQVSTWFAWALGIPIVLGLYYSNTWNAIRLPFLSASLFRPDGSKYEVLAVLRNSVLDLDKLSSYGLPILPASTVWKSCTHLAAIGALFAWVSIFYGKSLYLDFRFPKEQKDRHYLVMQKYKETPWWWYGAIGVVAFVAGLVVCIRGNTDLNVGFYFLATFLGILLVPLNGTLRARFGTSIIVIQLFKMAFGIMAPGKPLAMMYFVAFSQGLTDQAINQLGFLKIGQYLKIPPRILFFTQAYGMIVATVTEQVIISRITSTQRDALLQEQGSSSWSGVKFRFFFTDSVAWSMAKYIYAPNGYFIIPMSFLFGFAIVVAFAVIYKIKPTIRGYDLVQHFNMPIFLVEMGDIVGAVNSYKMTFVMISMAGQWARTHRPYFYNKYVFISTAGLDAATGIAVFFCSIVLFGAFGPAFPFPKWFGNPGGHIDHCPNILAASAKHAMAATATGGGGGGGP